MNGIIISILTSPVRSGKGKDKNVSSATKTLWCRRADGVEYEYEYHTASGGQGACVITRNGVVTTDASLKVGDSVVVSGKPARQIDATGP